MRVWIVGDNFGFPNGAGATARVHGFARALRAAGAELRVFCLTPTELPGRPNWNPEPHGVHDGIAFEYTCGTSCLPESLFERRWLRVRSARRLCAVAREARAQGAAPDVVLGTAQTLSGLAFALLAARCAGARAVLDACELPSGFVREGWRRSLHRLLYARLVRRMAGVLCVSTRLAQHWAAYAPAPQLRVPILVDVSRFTPLASDAIEPGRVVYAGNLAHSGELAALLEAFALAARAVPRATLQILGDDPGTDAIERLRMRAEQHGVADRVALPGAVDRATAARAIASAAVVALPRPKTPWAEAGLSAKLAEYLATGRPVVVTAIGDVPMYLEHGVSAWVVPAGDAAAFASALAEALGDRARADAIGARGREVALRDFDTRVHGPRLVAFFASLA